MKSLLGNSNVHRQTDESSKWFPFKALSEMELLEVKKGSLFSPKDLYLHQTIQSLLLIKEKRTNIWVLIVY